MVYFILFNYRWIALIPILNIANAFIAFINYKIEKYCLNKAIIIFLPVENFCRLNMCDFHICSLFMLSS